MTSHNHVGSITYLLTDLFVYCGLVFPLNYVLWVLKVVPIYDFLQDYFLSL